jgi:hypothetical protein
VTFAVNGHLEADDALPSSRGDRPLVSAIKRIVALNDPDWLVVRIGLLPWWPLAPSCYARAKKTTKCCRAEVAPIFGEIRGAA